MTTTSEKIAALAVELEKENAALRQRVSELQSLISDGIQQNSNCPGVLVALTPPSSIAFGQRWAIVFTIGPNNTRSPSLDDLFCPINTPDGKRESYLPMYETFSPDELPSIAYFLGTDDSTNSA